MARTKAIPLAYHIGAVGAYIGASPAGHDGYCAIRGKVNQIPGWVREHIEIAHKAILGVGVGENRLAIDYRGRGGPPNQLGQGQLGIAGDNGGRDPVLCSLDQEAGRRTYHPQANSGKGLR